MHHRPLAAAGSHPEYYQDMYICADTAHTVEWSELFWDLWEEISETEPRETVYQDLSSTSLSCHGNGTGNGTRPGRGWIRNLVVSLFFVAFVMRTGRIIKYQLGRGKSSSGVQMA